MSKNKGITFCNYKSAEISKGERNIKVDQFGVKTADECYPFGVDSQAVKNMIALYADTSNDSDKVIIGYINKNQLAKEGETRLFSVKSDGTLAVDIYLKNDGNIEIGGKDDNLVRYKALNQALQLQNNALNQELTKIATAISSLGGSYITAPVSVDISSAKIDNLKSS